MKQDNNDVTNQHIRKNYEKLLSNSELFSFYFGVPISDFWINMAIGFDVVKFDEWINPKENESTAEAIKRRYGLPAYQVVKNLL